MAKYSLEFKLDLINKFKEGKGSIKYIATSNNIHHSLLANWIRMFDEKGAEGINRSRNNKKYTQDFKIMIVREYLTTGISYIDLAIKYDISPSATISRWKLDYEKNGIMALQEKKKGRPTTMNTEQKQDNRTRQEKIDDKQKIKELEMRLKVVQAQNALLKKYQALGIPIPESLLKEY